MARSGYNANEISSCQAPWFAKIPSHLTCGLSAQGAVKFDNAAHFVFISWSFTQFFLRSFPLLLVQEEVVKQEKVREENLYFPRRVWTRKEVDGNGSLH